ncbi:MAG: phosphatidylserine/phosphatidylglycerophosphate/cardiolipin synthase family protein [Ktedonobacterales bacterium]|nr:phosphatidylserine/phosphatidylglycerophosphate/cardiolipin synthase family protein [Ktedonobacterales bacterium]
MTQPTNDTITTYFLAEGRQTGAEVAAQLAAFIRAATTSLDIAIYDFRLAPPTATVIAAALHERAAAGVAIRIAYDADKPPQPLMAAADPAPAGTGAFVQALGLPFRRIGGQKLMHNKYVVRDGATPNAAVWTGSLNFTDDAWTLQENNVITLASAEAATEYAQDFTQLWEREHIEGTGNVAAPTLALRYGGQAATAHILFSPANGMTIDEQVALTVARAQRRVRLCSMLLNSGALLNALEDVQRVGAVPIDGIYDQTQMAQVLLQWQDVPHNHWKINAVERIVAATHLVGKASTPYSPTSRHDFMHNKIIVVDDTVITGSYNFSRSAEENAENVLFIQSAPLADHYSTYIDGLKAHYAR